MDPEQIAALASAVSRALADALAPVLDALAPPAGDTEEDPPRDEEPGPGALEDDGPGAARDRLLLEIDSLRRENADLADRHDGLAARLARLKYERAFDGLAVEGVTFDRDREMEALLGLPVGLRDGHLDRIRDQYKRSPVGRRETIRVAMPADTSVPDEAEREAIRDYAIKNGLTIPVARERYRAERDGRA
jgi:hypothetical protein